MSSYESRDFHDCIRGPVFPVPTPFTERGAVDFDGLERYVDFLVRSGAPVIMLTVGTSRFNLLTREEIRSVNATVAKATGGYDAFTIVSGPGPTTGSTRENQEFARHAESIGADAIMLAYPERWYGRKPIVEFFSDVSDAADIPLMVHSVPLRDGFGGVEDRKYLDAQVLHEIAEVDGVIGVKEESGQRTIYESILADFKDQLVVIGAGGCMERFLGDSELGADTYLVGIGSFLPRLALEFFDAVEDNDRAKARRIVEGNEAPYFTEAVDMGWHRALKETLSQLDLMTPYERDPLTRLPQDDRRRIAEIIDGCGWAR